MVDRFAQLLPGAWPTEDLSNRKEPCAKPKAVSVRGLAPIALVSSTSERCLDAIEQNQDRSLPTPSSTGHRTRGTHQDAKAKWATARQTGDETARAQDRGVPLLAENHTSRSAPVSRKPVRSSCGAFPQEEES